MRPKVLGPVDNAFYYVDRPETPMNIGAVTVFDGPISFDALCKLVDTRIHLAPIYQQRIVQAPLNLGQATWVFDPDFYVGNHVFRVRLDPPGTDEQLRQMAGHLVSGMLDRSKPLWELYLIEGLSENRSAIFFKVHHCMVDGLAAVKLFTLLLDVTSEPPAMPQKPLYDPPPLPDDRHLLVDAVVQDLPLKWDVVQKLGHDLGVLGSVLADKEKRRQTLIGLSYLINDNLQLIKKLPINGRNTGKMTLAWSEFSLDEVRAIKTAQHASVNDVMLTVLSGAVDSYLRTHGGAGHQKFLRLLVPINMRAESETDQFGNRIAVLPVDIPFGINDPLERLRVVAEYTRVMKESSLSTGLDLILTLPSLAPAIVQPAIWGLAPTAFAVLAHAWCTNVAGPPVPVYLLGHQMLHTYGFFPLNPTMGLACVITSYNGHITMTLVADAGIVPQVTDLSEAVASAYLALRRAAKIPEDGKIHIEQPPPAAERQVAVERQVVEQKPAPEIPPADPPAAPIVPEAQAVPADPPVEQPLEVPVEQSVEAETIPRPEAVSVLPGNGKIPPAHESLPELVAVAGNGKSGVSAPTRHKLFSEEWAQAYRTAINHSDAYCRVSTNWEAGPLAFVMRPSAQHGFPRATAVLMELHKGHCLGARSILPLEAQVEANFVIEGDYETWMRVLSGKAQPLMMLILGRLTLKKGSMAKLLPFTQSAQELVNCAQGIS